MKLIILLLIGVLPITYAYEYDRDGFYLRTVKLLSTEYFSIAC